MVGHLLRHFQPAAVLQIRRDASGSKGVIADFRFDAGGHSPAPDHPVGVLLVKRVLRERLSRSIGGRAEERPLVDPWRCRRP